MNEAIAAAVILFHPDKDELRRNIASYLPFVSWLILFDNTPGGTVLESDLLQNEKIVHIVSNNNLGVAQALNEAATLAFNDKYKWLLTMDQDSYFETGEMEKYFSLFSDRFINDSSVAIVAPSQTATSNETQKGFIEETAVITSGNFLNLAIWNKLGGFEKKLFIDEVDHEYCYRAVVAGFCIIRFPSVQLNHRLGVKKEAGYGGVVNKTSRTIHSPRRVYFMVRNYLFVRKKYKPMLPDEFKKRDKMLLTSLKNNLFFSGHFFQTLKSIRMGYHDFKKNNFEATL